MEQLETWLDGWLVESGIDPTWVAAFRLLMLIGSLVLVSGLGFWVAKRVVIRYIYVLIRRSPIEWDDLLADHKVFNPAAHLVPAILVKAISPALFADFPSLLPVVLTLTDAYLVIVGTWVLSGFTRVGEFAALAHAAFKDKPIASYFQMLRIVLYLGSGVLVLSVLLGKSPLYFLSAFGAMTAILLLIFKDTILGLVASVQMSVNDMVRVGDWVEMPKFNADGDVVAINLNTVKVQNWDKTITNIPTYYFITDSFKNWRGMQQSGGRRIKRAIYLDAQTVRFVDPDTREGYKKIHLVSEFVTRRQAEIEAYNQEHGLDTSVLINGRRMTNLGVYRRYVEAYLRNHPRIRQDMSLMVRQLASEDRGIPLEIYCFTNTTAWVEYEGIQSDIFDHLFAATGFFGLGIYQQPSGRDFREGLGR